MSGQDCICTYLINVGSGLEPVSFFYYSIETQDRGSKTNIRNVTSRETCKVTYNECGCRCHPQPKPSPPPPPHRLYGYSFHLCIIYPIGGFRARDLNHCAFNDGCDRAWWAHIFMDIEFQLRYLHGAAPPAWRLACQWRSLNLNYGSFRSLRPWSAPAKLVSYPHRRLETPSLTPIVRNLHSMGSRFITLIRQIPYSELVQTLPASISHVPFSQST